MRSLSVLVLLSVAITAQAQVRPVYVAAQVPALLMGGNPDAVVRLDERRFDVQDAGRARETVRRVVTVFRQSGREQGEVTVPYDRFRRVERIEGRLYDYTGRLMRRSSNADLSDVSATDEGTLADDLRLKVLSLHDARYPYTVELTYEVRHEGLLSYPAWYPQSGSQPVEAASFTLVTPAGFELQIRPEGDVPVPTERQEDGRLIRQWQAGPRPSVRPEPYGPPAWRQADAVRFAPQRFRIGGVDGAFGTWKAFGDFYATLSHGRQRLPEAARSEVVRLVEGISDPIERARRVYRYVQERTRYVSIQLGIGGWQPFDATFVHTRGYGDCKALANYLIALLGEVGVEAFPALVHAGALAPPLLHDFPSNQFNHVIVFAPLARDTLWLEATSQTAPFGHLGSFTEGRHVLVVRPGASEIVVTPPSQADVNREVRTLRLSLTPGGAADAEVSIVATGSAADQLRGNLLTASLSERETWLVERFNTPGLSPVAADFSGLVPRADTARVTATLRMPRYATVAGRRLFVPLGLDRWRSLPADATPRTQPVAFVAYAFEDQDRIEITLPTGMRVEAIPAPVQVETPFARYERTVRQEGQMLVVERSVRMTQPTLPADAYEALRGFIGRVVEAERAQAVLVQQ